MAKNPEEIIDSLIEAAPDSLSPEELESMLQKAYEHGKAEASQTARENPPLEVTFFQELMQCLPDFVYFKDCESRFITLNPAHAAHFGAPIEDIVGKSDYDFFKREDADIKMEDEREILRTEKGFSEPRVEHHFKADGIEKWELSSKHPWHDAQGRLGGTFGLSRDITAKVRAERALEEQHRLMQTLINVLPCRIFVRDREDRFRLINDEYRRFLGGRTDEEVIGKTLSELIAHDRITTLQNEDETIMRTGVPVLRRMEYDVGPKESASWVSVSKVPLRGADGTIEGLVGVIFDISAQKEAEARVRAAGRELAAKNAQIESELSLARKLQTAFATFRFPSRLKLEDDFVVSADFLYEPSEHLAGDFFQLLQIDEHRFAAFICDVMGHGVRSALVTAVIRGLIEENREDLGQPDRLFTHISSVLNRLAQEPDFPRFVTASFALFDTRESVIHLANAGHPPILCHHGQPDQDGLSKMPIHRNPALGLLPDFQYTVSEAPLQTNCSYILYTDGIIEEPNPQGEEFGLEGIKLALEGIDPESPGKTIKRLRQHLSVHAGRSAFADDVCVMALSIKRL